MSCGGHNKSLVGLDDSYTTGGFGMLGGLLRAFKFSLAAIASRRMISARSSLRGMKRTLNGSGLIFSDSVNLNMSSFSSLPCTTYISAGSKYSFHTDLTEGNHIGCKGGLNIHLASRQASSQMPRGAEQKSERGPVPPEAGHYIDVGPNQMHCVPFCWETVASLLGIDQD